MEQSPDWEWLKSLRRLDAPVVPCIKSLCMTHHARNCMSLWKDSGIVSEPRFMLPRNPQLES